MQIIQVCSNCGAEMVKTYQSQGSIYLERKSGLAYFTECPHCKAKLAKPKEEVKG